MADFQPRFVDLVRNYTTSVGTGNFVLGPAVNGYTGFAAACQVGDSFYYSAIGLDKPAEREVGRGTLLAGGVISREPVSGPKTNFTGGTKAIALIAAAEWFAAAQSLVASVTPVGQSLATAASPADARGALELGGASLLETDADTLLAAESDTKVPTQKAVKAYVDARGGTGAATTPDRAALAGANNQAGAMVLREPGREGTFVWSAADLSAQVAADTAQGIHVAPSSDPTGASGAWVRDHKGKDINPCWFGAVEGDDIANAPANDAAITAMVSVLGAMSADYPSTTNFFLRRIRFPDGIFWVGAGKAVGDAVFDIQYGTLALLGEGGASATGGYGTTFKLASACTFVRTQTKTSTGASGGPVAAHASGGASEFRNFAVIGNYVAGSNAESEAHGFHLRAAATCDNVTVSGMPGDGFRAEGRSAADGSNANLVHITNCKGSGNRNNFLFEGSDANACSVVGCYGTGARQWDFWDSSFLGNAFIACLSESFVSPVGTEPPAGVSFGGNRYRVIAGQEAGASTNAPSGTTADNTWWYYIQAGAASTIYPAWASGTTYRAGGSYHNDNVNQKNAVYIGCYDESNGQCAQLGAPAVIIGGFLSINRWVGADNGWGSAPMLKSDSGGKWTTDSGLSVVSGTVTARLGGGVANPAYVALQVTEPTAASLGHFLHYDLAANDLVLSYQSVSTFPNTAFRVTGPATTSQFGTGAPVIHALHVPRLMLGDSTTGGRQVTMMSAAPTTGAHGQGEFAFYRGAIQGRLGSICRVAGTPGNWDDLYAMTADKQAAWTAWTGTGSKATKAVSTATAADCAAAIKSLIDDLKARGVLA